MNLVFTVLFAFAIGYVVKPRATAVLTYLALDAIVFAYQCTGVLLSWMADEPPVAFGPSPAGGFPVEYSSSQTWGYGAVNAAIIAIGVGLVVLGGYVAKRRAATREAVSVG